MSLCSSLPSKIINSEDNKKRQQKQNSKRWQEEGKLVWDPRTWRKNTSAVCLTFLHPEEDDADSTFPDLKLAQEDSLGRLIPPEGQRPSVNTSWTSGPSRVGNRLRAPLTINGQDECSPFWRGLTSPSQKMRRASSGSETGLNTTSLARSRTVSPGLRLPPLPRDTGVARGPH